MPIAGERLGSYKLLKQLGEGGMGAVFLARDRSLDRNVAIKFFSLKLLESEAIGVVRAFKERFIREARIAALINHPNVVQVYHAALDDELPYFVMEFLEGDSLLDHIYASKRIELSRICYYGLQLCDALRFAWEEHQMIHRDLKPGNIIILDQDRLKLLDLGIAKIVDATKTGHQLTSAGLQVGSPYYMAPEQQTGEARLDHRCDIFSLGILLCQMLTQRAPFEGETDYELHTSKMKGIPFAIEKLAPHAPLPPWR